MIKVNKNKPTSLVSIPIYKINKNHKINKPVFMAIIEEVK